MESQPPNEPKPQTKTIGNVVRAVTLSALMALGIGKGDTITPTQETGPTNPPIVQPQRSVLSTETHTGRDKKGEFSEKETNSSQGSITSSELVTSTTKTYIKDPNNPLTSELLSPLEGPTPANTPVSQK